ncbi:hypothetical protein [Streptomyces lunaelactis]|uniref:hypothetical protein n=1 Tax=Streptomyces lunaelactis TaxID=1535768 RepID=UPI0020C7785E|nr:hypothetical protein [Streptomyces lunaelactis]
MPGNDFREPGRVSQEFFDVQAQVIAEQAGLDATVVVNSQRPEALDARGPKLAGAALTDVVAPEVAVDDIDLDAIDSEDPAALPDASHFGVLVAGQRAQVGDDLVGRHG